MVLAPIFSLCRKLVTKSEVILCAGVLSVLSDQIGSCFLVWYHLLVTILDLCKQAYICELK